MRFSPAPRLLPLAIALALGSLNPSFAQAPQAATAAADADGYQQPSAAMRAVLDAPGLPVHQLSPDQKTLAVVQLQRHRTIAELARPIHRLAGGRYDAAAGGPQMLSVIESLQLRDLARPEAPARELRLPAGGAFHQLRWSPDGRRFLLNRRSDKAIELWVGDVATGAPTRTACGGTTRSSVQRTLACERLPRLRCGLPFPRGRLLVSRELCDHRRQVADSVPNYVQALPEVLC